MCTPHLGSRRSEASAFNKNWWNRAPQFLPGRTLRQLFLDDLDGVGLGRAWTDLDGRASAAEPGERDEDDGNSPEGEEAGDSSPPTLVPVPLLFQERLCIDSGLLGSHSLNRKSTDDSCSRPSLPPPSLRRWQQIRASSRLCRSSAGGLLMVRKRASLF